MTSLAAAVGVASAVGLTPEQAGWFVGAAVVFSGGRLSPDCDLWLGIAHRTVTHYLPFVLVAALVARVLLVRVGVPHGHVIGLGVGAGWLLHVVEDALTAHGVPMWPFTDHFRLLPSRVRVVAAGGDPWRRPPGVLFVVEWWVAVPALAVSWVLVPELFGLPGLVEGLRAHAAQAASLVARVRQETNGTTRTRGSRARCVSSGRSAGREERFAEEARKRWAQAPGAPRGTKQALSPPARVREETNGYRERKASEQAARWDGAGCAQVVTGRADLTD